MSEGYMLLLRNLVEEKLKGLVLILDTNLTVIFVLDYKFLICAVV